MLCVCVCVSVGAGVVTGQGGGGRCGSMGGHACRRHAGRHRFRVQGPRDVERADTCITAAHPSPPVVVRVVACFACRVVRVKWVVQPDALFVMVAREGLAEAFQSGDRDAIVIIRNANTVNAGGSHGSLVSPLLLRFRLRDVMVATAHAGVGRLSPPGCHGLLLACSGAGIHRS